MTLIRETSISPGFYTTDIKKLSKIDTTSSREVFDAAINELRIDRSKDKFVRDERFERSWDCLQGESRELIVELLEKYCAAEYSGFILYKELSYQLKEENGLLAEGFSLMSRDEARHASFLNKALSDFNLKPGLRFLKKEGRRYKFLPFSLFVYSTYLSEKISGCYYRTVFEHLKARPEYSIYPLFDFYKPWSEDEDRHGDFFGAILKTQPEFSDGFKAKLICKFFLLLNFSMSYFRSKKNNKIFALFGLDSREYSVTSIKAVNQSIGESLPVTLDLENPLFFDRLDACVRHLSENETIDRLNSSAFFNLFRKTPHYVAIALNLLDLLFVKTVDSKKSSTGTLSN